MLTENETYETYDKILRTARSYGADCRKSSIVQKAFKDKKRNVFFRRVNLPVSKQPVIYQYHRNGKSLPYRTFLVVEGSEGESFVGSVFDGKYYEVIHSHAINRYIERRGFNGTLNEAQINIFEGLNYYYVTNDYTDDTDYIYFDGGVFLCNMKDNVIHLRTFIMNRQCYPNQRILSLESENGIKLFKKELEID